MITRNKGPLFALSTNSEKGDHLESIICCSLKCNYEIQKFSWLIFFNWVQFPQSLGREIIFTKSSPRSQKVSGLLNPEDDKVTPQLATVERAMELINSRNIY